MPNKKNELYKMNKRVFEVLSYLDSTPQKDMIDNPIRVSCLHGRYVISHNDNHFYGFNLTDLRTLSRLTDDLTDRVVVVDINYLVMNGQIALPQGDIWSNYSTDPETGEPVEMHRVYLNKFKSLSLDSKIIDGDVACAEIGGDLP